MTKPNILLLTVDALRFDRLGMSGYGYKTSPVLDSMVEHSLWCENAFSLAPSTQPSMPTIMTSTRPLSYGGYDLGIKNRPNSLPLVLKRNGYHTSHEITFPWLRSSYGYDLGVDSTGHHYNITGIVGATVHTIRSNVVAYDRGELDSQIMLDKVSPLIAQCFRDIESYCEERLCRLESDKAHFSHSSFAVQDYDYKSVIQVVRTHQQKFINDPHAYIDQYIVGLPSQAVNLWISKEIKYKRRFGKKVGLVSDHLIGAAFSLFNESYSKLYKIRNKVYADSAELANRLISNIHQYGRSNRQQPFYLWSHFLDTHMPYCPGQLPNWPKNAKSYLRSTGYEDDLDLSAVCDKVPTSDEANFVFGAAYDSAVNYTDEQIGRVMDALLETGLLDSTLVVVAGDHGEELGEHGEYGHRFRFYDECVNVPIMFHMPCIKEQKIEGLADLTDIAPTVLGIADIEIPTSYVGDDLTSHSGNKDYIQMEVFHRGNCLFEKKPVYMGVRSKTHKYIWKEWQDHEDPSTTGNIELFDLNCDQHETKNIFRGYPEVVSELHDVVASRLAEIPEYCASRTPDDLKKNGITKHL